MSGINLAWDCAITSRLFIQPGFQRGRRGFESDSCYPWDFKNNRLCHWVSGL